MLKTVTGASAPQAKQVNLADLPSVDFGAFEAQKFHLYRSVLQPGGSVYTKLASFPLSA